MTSFDTKMQGSKLIFFVSFWLCKNPRTNQKQNLFQNVKKNSIKVN